MVISSLLPSAEHHLAVGNQSQSKSAGKPGLGDRGMRRFWQRGQLSMWIKPSQKTCQPSPSEWVTLVLTSHLTAASQFSHQLILSVLGKFLLEFLCKTSKEPPRVAVWVWTALLPRRSFAEDAPKVLHMVQDGGWSLLHLWGSQWRRPALSPCFWTSSACTLVREVKQEAHVWLWAPGGASNTPV